MNIVWRSALDCAGLTLILFALTLLAFCSLVALFAACAAPGVDDSIWRETDETYCPEARYATSFAPPIF